MNSYRFNKFEDVNNDFIKKAFVFALKNFKLVNFYYSSNKSTDNSYLQVLPIALIKKNMTFQLVAIKHVDDEFVLRRYNVDRMSDFRVSEFSANKSSLWSDVNSSQYSTQMKDEDVVILIDWDKWNVPKDYSAFSLKSNPDVIFIKSSCGTFFVSKKTVEKLGVDFLLPVEAINVVTALGDDSFDSFDVGDVVVFNVDGGWEKLTMTIIEKDELDRELVLCGIDKNREVYRISVPYNIVSQKGSKSKDRSSWD